MVIRITFLVLFLCVHFLALDLYAENIEKELPFTKKEVLEKAIRESVNVYSHIKEQEEQRKFENTFTSFTPENNSALPRMEQEARSILDQVGKKYGFSELVRDGGKFKKGQKFVSKRQKKKWPPITRRFYLVISSSLPKELLHGYALQALKLREEKGWHFTFVLQGFIGSAKKIKPTVSWIAYWNRIDINSDLTKKTKLIVPVEVNPQLVTKTKIIQVPALFEKDRQYCIVFGDTTLKKMVENIDENRCKITIGMVYDISEKNAIQEIKEYASLWMKENKDRVRKNLIAKVRKKLSNISCAGFNHASEAMSYITSGQYSLPFDIPDPRDFKKILYPKGFSYNPLDYVYYPGSFVLIDFNNVEEVSLFPKILEKAPKPVTVIVIGGNYLDIVERYAANYPLVHFYPSCYAANQLVKIYNILPVTPSLIVQEGNQWQVTVFSPKKHISVQN